MLKTLKERNKVLIVDDNIDNLKVVGKTLEDNDYEIIVAQSGEEAVETMKETKPDIILLDVMMDAMDGYTVCEILKGDSTTKDIPIIFLTAKNDTADIVRGFEIGGNDYVSKPFIKEELLARIKNHLNLKLAMDRIKIIANTDELTTVYNRRYGYEIIVEQINYCQKNQDVFTLCYIDIDNLKTINDLYGHEKGDMLICSVVKALKSKLNKKHSICRMGGDEFIVIFRGIDKGKSSEIIELVREDIKEKTIEECCISFSCGYAEYNPCSSLLAEDYINIADKHMLVEKRMKRI